METYMYKMIALSAIFILGYYVFLEKEKNHLFKRFYLLSSILFSLLIPLISINYGEIKVEGQQAVLNEDVVFSPEAKMVESSIFTTENILLGIYFLGFSLLLLKFSWGIFKIIKEIKTSEKLKQDHFQFILKQNKFTPYSFWNYVFLNKKDFFEGKIDNKIILHEKAHINQKHSLDMLFIEILLCVFWFNPALYLYRKAIITNHEFLADEEVLKQNQDVENYQKLILNELISEKILFTHPFNLHNTKKRIVMMTTKLTKLAKLKSYLTLPISAILFFAFVEKVPAKVEIKKENLNTVLNKQDTIKPKVENLEKNVKSKIKKEVGEVKIKKESSLPPPPPPYPHPKSKVKVKNNDIPPPPVKEITSQTEPEFPGGMNALRQKFAENFDTSKLGNNKGTIKGMVKIIVSEDGKNYNANYEFEDENFKIAAKDAVQKTLNGVTWKPGTLNGKPVASQLKLPITMNFQ